MGSGGHRSQGSSARGRAGSSQKGLSTSEWRGAGKQVDRVARSAGISNNGTRNGRGALRRLQGGRGRGSRRGKRRGRRKGSGLGSRVDSGGGRAGGAHSGSRAAGRAHARGPRFRGETHTVLEEHLVDRPEREVPGRAWRRGGRLHAIQPGLEAALAGQNVRHLGDDVARDAALQGAGRSGGDAKGNKPQSSGAVEDARAAKRENNDVWPGLVDGAICVLAKHGPAARTQISNQLTVLRLLAGDGLEHAGVSAHSDFRGNEGVVPTPRVDGGVSRRGRVPAAPAGALAHNAQVGLGGQAANQHQVRAEGLTGQEPRGHGGLRRSVIQIPAAADVSQ